MSEFLVIQALRFGDLLQTKRLVLTLAQRGHVHLLVAAPLVPLARMVYPQTTVHGIHLHGGTLDINAITENRKTFQCLRRLDIETVYNCNRAGLTEAICRLFSPEQVVGHRPCSVSNGGSVRSPWIRLHEKFMQDRSSACLNIVDYWAHFATNPIAPNSVNPPAKGEGRGIGVVLSGSVARRSLPVPMLAEIIKCFFGVYNGTTVYFFGTPADEKIAQKLLRILPLKMRGAIKNLAGKTDLLSLCGEIQGLDALISPDTGTMHLATHFGVPVRAFFLSSAFCHETGPYGEGHLVWQSCPACAPCLEAQLCNFNLQCLHCFDNTLFYRSLVRAQVAGSDISLPAHVQLWRGSFDAVGSRMSLMAGLDQNFHGRTQKRAAIARFLQCELSFGGSLTADMSPTMNFSDLDWMLPPGRYC